MSDQVFVSYAHADEAFIQALKEHLPEGYHVWTDRQIVPGRNWQEAIDVAIQQSFVVLVVLTPRSSESKYVTYEWSYALGLGRTVITLLLEKPPDIHPRLQSLQWLDFSSHFSIPWDKLRDALKAAQDTFRDSGGTSIAMTLLADGKEKQAGGDHRNALETLEAALPFAPDHQRDDLHYAIARSHWALKAYDQVEAHLNEALHYNPRHVQALVLAGELCRLQADQAADESQRESLLSRAEERFRAALDLQPDIRDENDESVRASLGGTLKRRNRIEEAIAEYNKAVAIKGTSYPYNNLGLLYMQQKDVPNMRAKFRVVRKLVSNQIGRQDSLDTWGYNDLLIAQIVLDDLDNAAETLETILAVPPADPLRSLLGTLEETMSDLPGASADTQAFIATAVQSIRTQLGATG